MKRFYIAALREMPIAIKTDDPKTQHYELPTSFFKLVLGNNLKYRYFLFIFLFNLDCLLLKVIDHMMNTNKLNFLLSLLIC